MRYILYTIFLHGQFFTLPNRRTIVVAVNFLPHEPLGLVPQGQLHRNLNHNKKNKKKRKIYFFGVHKLTPAANKLFEKEKKKHYFYNEITREN